MSQWKLKDINIIYFSINLETNWVSFMKSPVDLQPAAKKERHRERENEREIRD